MTITRDEIAWVYRVMLGREASEEEFDVWGAVPSLSQLSHACLKSDEFRSILGRHGGGSHPHASPGPQLSFDLPALAIEWQVEPAVQSRLLEHVTRTWTMLGKDAPHWSVLSSDVFLPDKIEESRSAFYATERRQGIYSFGPTV